MSGKTSQDENAVSEEPFWKRTLRPFVVSFQNPCNIQSYEVGIEAAIVTYLVTRFALKRPRSASKYSTIALFCVPLINWPICVALRKKAEELIPKEL